MKSRVPLEQLVAAPIRSMLNANRHLQHQALVNFLHDGEVDASGAWQPRTLDFKVGAADGNSPAAVRVPVATLKPQGSLDIRQAEVALAVEISRLDHRQQTLHAGTSPIRRQRRRSRRLPIVDVQVKLKRHDAPSGVEKVCLQLEKLSQR